MTTLANSGLDDLKSSLWQEVKSEFVRRAAAEVVELLSQENRGDMERKS